MKAAVQAYALGAEMERKGQFDQATHHYRRAFRLDSAPDKLYERAKSLLRQDGSKSVGASWDAQSDALLASSEVGDMIRRATDFDDSRVIAIAKREQEEKSKAAADAKLPSGSRPSQGRTTAEDDEGPPALEEDDQLEAIIARSSTAVEGRDLSQISFTGRPSPVRLSQRHKAPEADADSAVSDVAEKLDKARLNGEEGGEEPPPLIARLPDEILAYICRLVVEPRGQRGTRIRPPRVEGVADKHGNQVAAAKGEEKASNDKEKVPPSGNDTTTARPAKGPAGVGVVLAGADWQSLEMLARVSWKWRLASRIKGIWR
jgi:F-box protein 9